MHCLVPSVYEPITMIWHSDPFIPYTHILGHKKNSTGRPEGLVSLLCIGIPTHCWLGLGLAFCTQCNMWQIWLGLNLLLINITSLPKTTASTMYVNTTLRYVQIFVYSFFFFCLTSIIFYVCFLQSCLASVSHQFLCFPQHNTDYISLPQWCVSSCFTYHYIIILFHFNKAEQELAMKSRYISENN